MLITDDESPFDVEVDETAILLRFDRTTVDEFADQIPVLRRNILRKIGGAVRDTVVKQRKRSLSRLVAFIHENTKTRLVVAETARRLAAIGEKIGVMCDSLERPYDPSIPYVSLVNENGEYVDEQDVRSFLAQWPDLKRIFLVVDQVHPPEKLIRLVELANVVMCMSTTATANATIDSLKGLLERSLSWKKKMHVVWVLGEDETVVPYLPELPSVAERDFKVQLTDPLTVTRLYDQGIDRIVHYLRGVSLGVALSGGGAHGMSHLGVLRALEEAGITIDLMAGTSAGVLTGVIYCAGYSPAWGIEHFTNDLEPGSIYKRLPKGDDFYMLTKYRTHAWEKMLRKYVFDWRLEQLPIPINTVATDLISARSVVRSTGDAVNGLLESINLPVISAPICRDGMLLVDGGVLNNLPASELVKLGCNMIIGVDVAAHVEHRVGKNLPSTPTEKMKAPGAVTTLMRCLRVQAHNLSSMGADSADVVIAPDVSRFEPTAFTKTPEMAEIGYQATKESIPQIRESLHALDAQLFPK